MNKKILVMGAMAAALGSTLSSYGYDPISPDQCRPPTNKKHKRIGSADVEQPFNGYQSKQRKRKAKRRGKQHDG